MINPICACLTHSKEKKKETFTDFVNVGVTGAEQTTVCLLLLAILFTSSSILNIWLYLRVFYGQVLSLILAVGSDVIAGIYP